MEAKLKRMGREKDYKTMTLGDNPKNRPIADVTIRRGAKGQQAYYVNGDGVVGVIFTAGDPPDSIVLIKE